MKKILISVLILLMALLVACSGDASPESIPESIPESVSTAIESMTESEESSDAVAESSDEEPSEVEIIDQSSMVEGDTVAPQNPEVMAQPAAVTPDTNTYYFLQNMAGEGPNLCLEGQGGPAPDSGAVLDGAAFMSNCQAVAGQQWRLVDAGNGYYKLQNMIGEAQNLCLEGQGGAAPGSGAVLDGAAFMDACQDVTGQFWKLIDLANGYYRLQNMAGEEPNLCLEGQGGAAPGSGAVLDGAAFMDDCQDVTGQLWKLMPVDGSSNTAAGGTETSAQAGSCNLDSMNDPASGNVAIRFVNPNSVDVHLYQRGSDGWPVVEDTYTLLKPGESYDIETTPDTGWVVYESELAWQADEPSIYELANYTVTAEAKQCVDIGIVQPQGEFGG